MEKVGQTLANQGRLSQGSYDDLVQTILADKDIATFITTQGLTADEIKLSLPKFNQYLMEKERFRNQDPGYLAKGYEPILTMNEGYADVTYLETKELKEAQKKAAIEDRITIVSLPKSYKHISFDDVLLDDVKRVGVYERLVDFVSSYPQAGLKGLYLYGDMGIGKSFLLAAMARELSEQKGVATTMIHFPSFAIDVRNAITTGTVKEEIDAVKAAPILIIDDIGAEQTSTWIRDEVLQVILQYRMLEELPTFFTSNYSMADLEQKLATMKSGDESWQAKRVMERVRFLAQEMHLQGDNRR
ncbi:primosomal protein DnaI [Streptococcus caprae]|uniref:Primosomal protein DnaI n=1 Tax=Streptococcus caprae TaxID=1640501 RepID=A0ABV8CX55_9STRE